MPLFKLFNKKPIVEGQLGYFGLGDWWLSTFTEKERNYIERVYKPLTVGRGANSRPLTQGEILGASGTAVGLLSGLAGWFRKPADLSIAMRILKKADELNCPHPLDKHFLYQAMIEIYYRARDVDPAALSRAIDACQKQINIAPQAAKAFKKEYSGTTLPSHVGYTQLAIIREKQKEYSEAISICKQAKKQGWNGDWDQRIARYEKKLYKQSS